MDVILLNILISLGPAGILVTSWGIIRLGNHILDWWDWKAYQKRERKRITMERKLYVAKEAYGATRTVGLDTILKNDIGLESGPVSQSETIPKSNDKLPRWSLKVLDVFGRSPDAKLSSKQVAGQTHLSRKRAWEILNYLMKQGILRRNTTKRPYVYSIRQGSSQSESDECHNNRSDSSPTKPSENTPDFWLAQRMGLTIDLEPERIR